MGDGTQVLHAVALFLQRILGRARPLDHNLTGVNFKGLLGLRGQQHFPRNTQGTPHILFGNLVEVVHFPVFKDNLHTLKAAAIIQVDKTQRLAVAD